MSGFNLQARPLPLVTAQPFTIARGTKQSITNVLVTLTANGINGYGEAGPNRRYNEDADKVMSYCKALPADFFEDINAVDQLTQKLDTTDNQVQSAKAAIEMAWLDWQCKTKEQPLWKLWNAPSNKTPPTSYTIGLDTIEVMQQKVAKAEQYPILKVKLGTNRDRDIIKGLREITDRPIRVDANEGWEDLPTARKMIRFLAEQNVEFVEQPMPASNTKEMVELKQWSPLPLVADESFLGEENLDEIANQFHGINIKLMKMGSLIKARKVINQAHQRRLKVMVGCMIESSLGISAGALLGTWADFVDLDGHLLLEADPFKGIELTSEKEILLSGLAGLGVYPQ